MCKRILLILAAGIVLFLPVISTATCAENQWEMFTFPGDVWEYHMPRMNYWVYTPEDMKEGLPLVIYLHSSIGLANKALQDILPSYINDGTIPSPNSIVLIPQIPLTKYEADWISCINSLDAIIEDVIETYHADTNRVSLVGFSLGGIGVFDLSYMHPERYERILSICGRVNYHIINNRNVNPDAEIRVATAKGDSAVNSATAVYYANTLAEEGYKASHKEYEKSHKDTALEVLRDEEILKWLWLESEEKENDSSI